MLSHTTGSPEVGKVQVYLTGTPAPFPLALLLARRLFPYMLFSCGKKKMASSSNRDDIFLPAQWKRDLSNHIVRKSFPSVCLGQSLDV